MSHLKHINPAELSAPRGYSHAVEVSGGRTIYVSGQIAIDREGRVIGARDFEAQTRQVFENLKAALTAARATFDDVAKITVFVTDVAHVGVFRAVRDAYFTGAPPSSSFVQVAALVRPELMVEVEAIAVAS
jgi:reactive intermediate/imine deaminase